MLDVLGMSARRSFVKKRELGAGKEKRRDVWGCVGGTPCRDR